MPPPYHRQRPPPPRPGSGAYHHRGDQPPESPPAGLEGSGFAESVHSEPPPSEPPIVVEAEIGYGPEERRTDAQIRAINGPGPLPAYPPPSLRHAGKAPRKDSPPPGSLRSQIVDALADTPRGRARARLVVTVGAFLLFGGGAGAAKLWGRAWLDAASTGELKAVDDRHAEAAASMAERVVTLEQREAARATEEERRRQDEKLRVLEEQNRALQEEVRKAYRANPGRAPVVVEPGRP